MSKSIKSFVVISSSFALMLSLSTALWGGTTGKIAGRVTDAATGELLAGANVMIVGTALGAAADAEGDYFIINIPPGTYEVTVSMIGYQTLTLTEVVVRIDLTTPVDFNLTSTVITGEAVTVTAEREIIKMDQSASAVHASISEIQTVPLVKNITEYIALQAGIEGDIIRGGGLDQTQFMLDGMMVVDNRANKPMMSVNLSSVQEISIIKGGFNAEYGNVRSGVINVITKEGAADRYHGSVDFRYSPAQLKHSGASLMNNENWYLRSYLGEETMWLGTYLAQDIIGEDTTITYNGVTYYGVAKDQDWQDRNRKFKGWVKISQDLADDDNPANDLTPEQARDIFIFRHASEGSAELGQEEKEYGHLPDIYADLSFSGPVPVIGRYLGDLSFFVSHSSNNELFAVPQTRDYYQESNTQLKFTSRLTPTMKLTLEGLYGEVHSINRSGNDAYHKSASSPLGVPSDVDFGGGTTILTLYYMGLDVPMDVYRNMQGLSLEHTLSPSTFYTIKLSRVNVRNRATDFIWRDRETVVATIGTKELDESPWGYSYLEGCVVDEDNAYLTGLGGPHDSSHVTTYNAQFDITSQVNKYNQVKAGFLYVTDDLFTQYEGRRYDLPSQDWKTMWEQTPSRLGAYIQDKLEFEGMVANFGLRLDYNNPNTDWYLADRYSKYFKSAYKYAFMDSVATDPVEGRVKISPRLGISHPISETAKMYFNYGHFYSMPSSNRMYGIEYGNPQNSISSIGDPSADLPRTIAYELGYEQSIAGFLIHLSGYYKDVSDQVARVRYISADESISYQTIENTNYEDIRGFELNLNKPYGRWFTGWLNYNYMVSSTGWFGRLTYYEDVKEQAVQGLQEPDQDRPLARPILRCGLNFMTPSDLGPILGLINVGLVYQWRAGGYVTWDPLETLELFDNLQWKGEGYLDLRLRKSLRFGDANIALYADIKNVLDLKFLNDEAFRSNIDREDYYKSLKLPMYKDTDYAALDVEGGDDKLGDLKSDKDYIDMPDREFLTFINPRFITLGMTFNF